MRKVIANTTPIIALANTGHLDILKALYGQIYIPQGVFDEVLSEPARTLVSDNSDWIIVKEIKDKSKQNVYSARLHKGEVEVMILAQETEADLVILDDEAARKTARYLGLTVTGTMGVLLKAKEKRIVDEVKPIIKELLDDGLYIGDEVVCMVLRIAGEMQ